MHVHTVYPRFGMRIDSQQFDMRGFRVDAHGGLEALQWYEALPEPVPGPGEVVVAVEACALNHLDLWVRKGVPGHRFPLPLVPGSEVAGRVIAHGPGVTDPPPGTPVLVGAGVSCGRCWFCLAGKDALCERFGLLGEDRDGGYAERVAVPARNLFPIPRGFSFVEAAAVPLVFLTAWHMLVDRARLQPHESVLVQAAGSGVSTAAIQLCRLLGANPILAASTSPQKRQRALELGATEVIDSSSPDFWREVRSKTAGRGVDVVLDHVGGELFEKSLRCLARGGRLVFCGATAAAEANLPLRQIFFKNQSVLGSTMGSNHELATVLGFFDRGMLRPVIAQTFPFEAAREAQALLESRAVFGKIVLEIGSIARTPLGGSTSELPS